MSEHEIDLRSEVGEDGEAVIIVAGDVDLRTAPVLRDLIEEMGATSSTVVLDLGDVRYMDSPGLGTLIYCHRQLDEAGHRLTVRRAQGHVRELMALTHADHLLEDSGH
jgi:anti-sigma B factor antagonist